MRFEAHGPPHCCVECAPRFSHSSEELLAHLTLHTDPNICSTNIYLPSPQVHAPRQMIGTPSLLQSTVNSVAVDQQNSEDEDQSSGLSVYPCLSLCVYVLNLATAGFHITSPEPPMQYLPSNTAPVLNE